MADQGSEASRYTARVIRTAALTPQMLDAMSALYLSCYDGSSDALFRHDLAVKDEVLLLHHHNALVGFTALQTYRTHWQSHPIRVLYSGDTLVHPAHWGQQTLAFAWLRHAGRIWRQEPQTPLYWFLLVKGHRTYKYLRAFARSFHPDWRDTHTDLQQLAQALAQARFGTDYDPRTGVIHFPQSRGHLKAELAEASLNEREKEANQFFFARNPGYRQGDELVCLCELSAANLKPIAARAFNAVDTAATALV